MAPPAFMCFSHACYCTFLYNGFNIWGKIHHLSGQGVVVMGNVWGRVEFMAWSWVGVQTVNVTTARNLTHYFKYNVQYVSKKGHCAKTWVLQKVRLSFMLRGLAYVRFTTWEFTLWNEKDVEVYLCPDLLDIKRRYALSEDAQASPTFCSGKGRGEVKIGLDYQWNITDNGKHK